MFDDFSPGADSLFGSGATHPNPAFNYLTAFVPRKLKDLFKWAEYLGVDSAHIYGVVKKFGEFPITRFEYDTENDANKRQHKKLFEEQLNFKGELVKASFDKWIYGNGFYSLYEPIKRELECASCKHREDITSASYSFLSSTTEFRLRCKACKTVGIAKNLDTKLRNPEKLRIIRWDPKLIDIDQNPITGETAYYCSIPRTFVHRVKDGDKLFINHTPMDVLRAVKDSTKTFRFAEDQIFHMKVPGPAGVEAQWGMPPITSAIKLFLFASILRKANEAIALEHIVPFRVFYPKAASANGDPVMQLNLAQWKAQLEGHLRIHRKDPLHMMFSPVPVDKVDLGGDGRALMTFSELQQAEQNIVLSMGVPMEFLTGGLGQTRGEITLRMIENQLQTHVDDLNGFTAWVERKASAFLRWPSVPTKLADFKMLDDETKVATYLQLWQAGKLSDTAMGNLIDHNFAKDRKQKKEDQIQEARATQEVQQTIQKQQASLANQAKAQAQVSQGGPQYDTQAIFQQADQIIQDQNLLQIDDGSLRSKLDDLKKQDPLMGIVVADRIEQQRQAQTQDAKAQAQ